MFALIALVAPTIIALWMISLFIFLVLLFIWNLWSAFPSPQVFWRPFKINLMKLKMVFSLISSFPKYSLHHVPQTGSKTIYPVWNVVNKFCSKKWYEQEFLWKDSWPGSASHWTIAIISHRSLGLQYLSYYLSPQKETSLRHCLALIFPTAGLINTRLLDEHSITFSYGPNVDFLNLLNY